MLYRLFQKQEQGGEGGRESSPMNALDQSLLDIVLGGARELRRTLPTSDQQKLDEYLADPQLPFFFWLRTLAGLKLAETHRRHLGTQLRDADREGHRLLRSW